MAWLAHAKGVRKGKGKGSTPSGASKGNGKLAIEDAHEEGENQELAGKLSVGKRFKSGEAKEAAEPESLKKSEDEPKEKKKDRNGEECEPKKKKKKNKNDEEVKKNNDNNGEETEERKRKNKGKNGEEADEAKRKSKNKDKNGEEANSAKKDGEEANAAKKRKNENNNEEGNEEPLTVKKKSKIAKEPSDGTPEAEDKDESAPEISAAAKKKRKNDMALALRVPTKAFQECDDEGEEEEANLNKKPSKATWTEEPKNPKKMEGKVGHPLVRLRTKTSEESLDSRHVTPDRPTTKPASPGSSGTSRSSEKFNA